MRGEKATCSHSLVSGGLCVPISSREPGNHLPKNYQIGDYLTIKGLFSMRIGTDLLVLCLELPHCIKRLFHGHTATRGGHNGEKNRKRSASSEGVAGDVGSQKNGDV